MHACIHKSAACMYARIRTYTHEYPITYTLLMSSTQRGDVLISFQWFRFFVAVSVVYSHTLNITYTWFLGVAQN